MIDSLLMTSTTTTTTTSSSSSFSRFSFSSSTPISFFSSFLFIFLWVFLFLSPSSYVLGDCCSGFPRTISEYESQNSVSLSHNAPIDLCVIDNGLCYYPIPFIVGITGSVKREYITVTSLSNTNTWTLCTNCTGNDTPCAPYGGQTGVSTSFSAIRLDPLTLLVDQLDGTFSTTTGCRPWGSSGDLVRFLPYASGPSCTILPLPLPILGTTSQTSLSGTVFQFDYSTFAIDGDGNDFSFLGVSLLDTTMTIFSNGNCGAHYPRAFTTTGRTPYYWNEPGGLPDQPKAFNIKLKPNLFAPLAPSTTPSASGSLTPSRTASSSLSASNSYTPSISPSASETASSSVSISNSISLTPSKTPSSSSSETPSSSSSTSSSTSLTPSRSSSPSLSLTPSSSVTLSFSASSSTSLSSSSSLTPSSSISPSSTQSPSGSSSSSPSLTSSPTLTLTSSNSLSSTVTPSLSHSSSSALSPTSSHTPISTVSSSSTLSSSLSVTSSNGVSSSSSITPFPYRSETAAISPPSAASRSPSSTRLKKSSPHIPIPVPPSKSSTKTPTPLQTQPTKSLTPTPGRYCPNPKFPFGCNGTCVASIAECTDVDLCLRASDCPTLPGEDDIVEVDVSINQPNKTLTFPIVGDKGSFVGNVEVPPGTFEKGTVLKVRSFEGTLPEDQKNCDQSPERVSGLYEITAVGPDGKEVKFDGSVNLSFLVVLPEGLTPDDTCVAFREREEGSIWNCDSQSLEYKEISTQNGTTSFLVSQDMTHFTGFSVLLGDVAGKDCGTFGTLQWLAVGFLVGAVVLNTLICVSYVIWRNKVLADQEKILRNYGRKGSNGQYSMLEPVLV